MKLFNFHELCKVRPWEEFLQTFEVSFGWVCAVVDIQVKQVQFVSLTFDLAVQIIELALELVTFVRFLDFCRFYISLIGLGEFAPVFL